MDNVYKTGLYFYGISMVVFGMLHFILGEFITGRAPAWSPDVPGRLAWAYATGAVLILGGAAVIIRKKARTAAVIMGTMIFLWAGLRQIPMAIADTNLGGIWTSTFKALTFFGGSFIVAGSLPEEKRPGFIKPVETFLISIGRYFVGAFLMICGVQHFIWLKFVTPWIPAWLFPGPVFWTCFTGVALIAGGIGFIFKIKGELAAALSAAMIFSWVLILHIPRSIASPENSSEFIGIFEALAFSGILLVLAQQLRKEKHPE